MCEMQRAAVAGFIFARGGSKGVPGKNIRSFGGKPLIAYAIEAALACDKIDSVIVSTDDSMIADVAVKYGADVPFMRPAALAQDNSPEHQAWQHAITWFLQNRGPMKSFVCVPATAPLRTTSDIAACIELLDADPTFDIVVTATPASRSPWFNMVKRVPGEGVKLVNDEQSSFRRQDVPEVFDLATVAYAARPEFILASTHYFEGKVGMVVVPTERAIDIDTELDFEIAEFLLHRKVRET